MQASSGGVGVDLGAGGEVGVQARAVDALRVSAAAACSSSRSAQLELLVDEREARVRLLCERCEVGAATPALGMREDRRGRAQLDRQPAGARGQLRAVALGHLRPPSASTSSTDPRGRERDTSCAASDCRRLGRTVPW